MLRQANSSFSTSGETGSGEPTNITGAQERGKDTDQERGTREKDGMRDDDEEEEGSTDAEETLIYESGEENRTEIEVGDPRRNTGPKTPARKIVVRNTPARPKRKSTVPQKRPRPPPTPHKKAMPRSILKEDTSSSSQTQTKTRNPPPSSTKPLSTSELLLFLHRQRQKRIQFLNHVYLWYQKIIQKELGKTLKFSSIVLQRYLRNGYGVPRRRKKGLKRRSPTMQKPGSITLDSFEKSSLFSLTGIDKDEEIFTAIEPLTNRGKGILKSRSILKNPTRLVAVFYYLRHAPSRKNLSHIWCALENFVGGSKVFYFL